MTAGNCEAEAVVKDKKKPKTKVTTLPICACLATNTIPPPAVPPLSRRDSGFPRCGDRGERGDQICEFVVLKSKNGSSDYFAVVILMKMKR